MSLLHATPDQAEPIEGARHIATRAHRRSARSMLATVPIAIAGTLALTLNLITPAQAATGEKRDSERSKDRAADGRGSTTSLIAAARSTSASRLAAASAPAKYTVVSGDTVSGIAGRFGLSTASVLALNGLSWKSLIFPGQVLALTAATSAAPAPRPAPAPAPAPAPSIAKYVVVSGDTISGIAERHGVSTQSVLSANGLDRSSLIFPGQSITIPLPMAPAAHTVAAPAPVPAPAPAAPATPRPTPGQVIPLTDEMRANAAIIVAVGRHDGVDDYGLIIALAAAMQESGLRNLDHGDRDSLGLFQQRPSTGWGPAAQIMDPNLSALAFFGGANNPNKGRTKGLLDIPNWHSLTVAQAAQAVQISAYPDAYAAWETSARAWVGQLR